MKRRVPLVIVLVIAMVAAVAYGLLRPPRQLILTGIVTTDQVLVSPEIQGRLQQLLVREGDAVTNGQLLAVLQPQEWKADLAFYSSSQQQSAAQVDQAQASLNFEEAQTTNQIRQAEANLESAEAQVNQAKADLDIAGSNFNREQDLFKRGVNSPQAFDQSRATFDSAKARLESMRKQVLAAQATVALAKANQDQVAVRRAALEAATRQMAAVAAQRDKAKVRLDYTQIHAPIPGLVDVRAALQGEVVNPGQAIVTLLDPDNFWVRADVEETYIDRIKLKDKLAVRLPSGVTREGEVFYRRVDADYATQRDVSRAKRDIKTFEIRLRCANHDRALAVGMTAYVSLPLK